MPLSLAVNRYALTAWRQRNRLHWINWTGRAIRRVFVAWPEITVSVGGSSQPTRLADRGGRFSVLPLSSSSVRRPEFSSTIRTCPEQMVRSYLFDRQCQEGDFSQPARTPHWHDLQDRLVCSSQDPRSHAGSQRQKTSSWESPTPPCRSMTPTSPAAAALFNSANIYSCDRFTWLYNRLQSKVPAS